MTDDKNPRSFEDLNDALLQMEPDELNARLDHALTDPPRMDPQPPPPAVRQPSVGISFADLMAKSFPAPRWIVKGLIGEGLTLFAGAPKIGKSWFALDLALSVSGGAADILGGTSVEHGAVLYMALEDNQPRLQDRLNKMGARLEPRPLRFVTSGPGLESGLEEDIRTWSREQEAPRLVIIDTLAKVRPVTRPRDRGYADDHATLAPLQKLAGELGLGIVVIHHTNKAPPSDDPFDAISGTLALSGTSDAGMVLRRSGEGATLYTRGRDVEERQITLSFDKSTFRWREINAPITPKSPERDQILHAFKSWEEELSVSDIADRVRKPKENVQRTVSRMSEAGELVRVRTGIYRLPAPPTDPSPDSPNGPNTADGSYDEHPARHIPQDGYWLAPDDDDGVEYPF